MRTHQKPRRRPSERKEGQEAGSMKTHRTALQPVLLSRIFCSHTATLQYSNSDDVDTLAVSFF